MQKGTQATLARLGGNTELSDDKIDELRDTFINILPALLKTQLQTA